MNRPQRSVRPATEKSHGNIDAAITHRTQNRDLLYLREDRHREDIENSEASQQNDERNRNRNRHSQGQKKLERALLAFLPAKALCWKSVSNRLANTGARFRSRSL